MEDKEIVDLYWERSETANEETVNKYERYCFSIANNIINDIDDALECVNHVYLATWNSIPTHRPVYLNAFLGKITRNLSLDYIRKNGALKRGGGTIQLVLDELVECIPDISTVEQRIEERELVQSINIFLKKLPERDCNVFVRRYWYAESIEEVARFYGMGQSKVKSILFRVRNKLRKYLEGEGIAI